MSSLVALILGAGPNVGYHVAKTLQSQRYKVALGSCNPDVDALKKEGLFPVKVDVTLPDSVSAAYKTSLHSARYPQRSGVQWCILIHRLCVSNTDLLTAAVWRFLKVEADPLSLPLEDFKRTLAVTTSVYSVAQDALKGFRSLTSGPKTFIVTGNILPFLSHDNTILYDLQTLKVVEAHLIEVFYNAYIKEDIRFHFALLISPEGGIPAYSGFLKSGPAHAKVYWELISSKEPKGWDYRFAIDGKEWSKVN
ncbi:hypothetical protein EDD18DRAFT_1347013 [Armillaria luteobubalina]|uniref:NAD(P)-binding protein n=1 Tax=Armillaria luteobubalina TaxID=153913 RepID=A0AA39QGE9_9AGAR|nr:hypothetical protein EDD18DRAFT_1347013 [Armillaria luteobubalina]